MQVERRRSDRGLAQHHVNLCAMVCLVIEEVAECYGRGLHTGLSLIVDVGERLFGKPRGQFPEE
jgi:hypothetical protein